MLITVETPMRWMTLTVMFALAAACGCTETPAETPPVPGAAANPARASGPVRVTTVTPDRLAMNGDRIAPQTIQVSYAIDDPLTVNEATLELYHPDLFRLAKMTLPLPVQASGEVSFAAEPSEHKIGPEVRFRAVCPEGTTGWYVMGQIPQSFDAASRSTFGIHSVRPESIPARNIPTPPDDPAVRAQVSTAEIIYVSGGQLTAACRLEAQVNGAAITLANVNLIERNTVFQALLYFRDLDFTPVARRYAELKLTVTRPNGSRHGAIERLPLNAQ